MTIARLKRSRGTALVVLASAASWLAMMITHETGHVINAYISGGSVSRVVLHPLTFSRTDLSENPHPLFVTWGGVVWGSALPLLLWLLGRVARLRLAFLLRYFAGFCLIANGAYLATAVLVPVGDSEDLLRLGVPLWTLVVPGVAAISVGFALWNRLGANFGFDGQTVDRAPLLAVSLMLAALIGGMVVWSAMT